MTIKSLVIALTRGHYDNQAGEEFHIPQLSIYSSANAATADQEGIDIAEGDLWFFGADGSPLQAKFTKKPYINSERKTYFPGVYTLHPGFGDTLQDVLSEIAARNQEAWVVVYLASTDDLARKNGWPAVATMKEEVELALKILPPDIIKLVKLEWGPAIARVTATRH